MANQQKAPLKPTDKTTQMGKQQVMAEEQKLGEFAAATTPSSSLSHPATSLNDTRFFAAQRQALAVQLNRTAGNHYLQRALSQIHTAMREDDAAAPHEPIALDEGSSGGSGSAGPKPTFDHSGGTTVTINADSAIDFANNITATIGSPHTSPEFTPDIQYDFKTDSSGKEIPGTQKIKSIGLTVKTAITKVRFGSGRPNANHKKAIDEMVEAIKTHEEAHRAIVEAAATAALAAAQKYVGTSKVSDANKALTTDLECTTNKKHEALDAKEGLLTANEQTDGTVTVTKSASGAKYPCPGAEAKS